MACEGRNRAPATPRERQASLWDLLTWITLEGAPGAWSDLP